MLNPLAIIFSFDLTEYGCYFLSDIDLSVSRSNESLLFNADRWRACVIDPVLTVFWPRDFNLRWGLDEFTLVLIWFFEAFDCHEYLPRLKATRKDYHLDHFTRKKV